MTAICSATSRSSRGGAERFRQEHRPDAAERARQLETPILLTNTFAVGTCATPLIRRAIAADPEIGRQTSTVNPVVPSATTAT